MHEEARLGKLSVLDRILKQIDEVDREQKKNQKKIASIKRQLERFKSLSDFRKKFGR